MAIRINAANYVDLLVILVIKAKYYFTSSVSIYVFAVALEPSDVLI